MNDLQNPPKSTTGLKLLAAAIAASSVIGFIAPHAGAEPPQPTIVRLVRVSAGRWEGTACWPDDGGVEPHCFQTALENWEPLRFGDGAEAQKFDAGK